MLASFGVAIARLGQDDGDGMKARLNAKADSRQAPPQRAAAVVNLRGGHSNNDAPSYAARRIGRPYLAFLWLGGVLAMILGLVLLSCDPQLARVRQGNGSLAA